MQTDRPSMPSGYGISVVADGQLDWAWAAERLLAARNYWVCTSRSDGRPHAMPVWGLWLDGAVVFSTDPASLKGRNLAARPDVVVHLESGDDVVIVEGRVRRLGPDDLPDGFVDAYAAKYDERLDMTNPAFGCYAVSPSRMLAWWERDFPTSATRFQPA